MTEPQKDTSVSASTSSVISEKPSYLRGMNFVLAKSQEGANPYTAIVLGQDFRVLPDVFSPAYYAETAFYTQHVVDLLRPGEDYLDLGCGAGVTAVMAAKKGANITALDINPAAVENTRQNAKLHEVENQVRVVESDVYAALGDEKFDTIYWNVPFGFRNEGTELTPLEKAIFDVGYRKNREFIMGAKKHLKSGGQLLMGVSSTLGDLAAIQRFAREAGITFEQIAEMDDPDAPYEIKFQLLRATV
jgi:release factor glutamine methyltransferase